MLVLYDVLNLKSVRLTPGARHELIDVIDVANDRVQGPESY